MDGGNELKNASVLKTSTHMSMYISSFLRVQHEYGEYMCIVRRSKYGSQKFAILRFLCALKVIFEPSKICAISNRENHGKILTLIGVHNLV